MKTSIIVAMILAIHVPSTTGKSPVDCGHLQEINKGLQDEFRFEIIEEINRIKNLHQVLDTSEGPVAWLTCAPI